MKVDWINIRFETTGKRSNIEYIVDILENIYEFDFESITIPECYVNNNNDVKFEAVINLTENELVQKKDKIEFLNILDKTCDKYGFTYTLKFLDEKKYVEVMSRIFPDAME